MMPMQVDATFLQEVGVMIHCCILGHKVLIIALHRIVTGIRKLSHHLHVACQAFNHHGLVHIDASAKSVSVMSIVTAIKVVTSRSCIAAMLPVLL